VFGRSTWDIGQYLGQWQQTVTRSRTAPCVIRKPNRRVCDFVLNSTLALTEPRPDRNLSGQYSTLTVQFSIHIMCSTVHCMYSTVHLIMYSTRYVHVLYSNLMYSTVQYTLCTYELSVQYSTFNEQYSTLYVPYSTLSVRYSTLSEQYSTLYVKRAYIQLISHILKNVCNINPLQCPSSNN